jgi:hypothetical protein
MKCLKEHAPARTSEVEEAKLGTASVVTKKVERDSAMADKWRMHSYYACPITCIVCLITCGKVNIPNSLLKKKREAAAAVLVVDDELLQITNVKIKR